MPLDNDLIGQLNGLYTIRLIELVKIPPFLFDVGTC